MYDPILKEISKNNLVDAVRDVEANFLSMHEELVRVIGELYERMEEWEENK